VYVHTRLTSEDKIVEKNTYYIIWLLKLVIFNKVDE